MMRFTVTVDDGHLSQLGEVAKSLSSEGMEIDQVLPLVGCVTGWAPEGARETLARIPGVVALSLEEVVHISPPDADIQ
jgi:hypothetical protein